MATYKWGSPHEWLADKARDLAIKDDTAELLSLVTSVLDLLDADQIQDVFQIEMDEDGYFDDTTPAKLVKCSRCGCFVNPAFGADSPTDHQDAEGTEEDPRSPSDRDEVCEWGDN